MVHFPRTSFTISWIRRRKWRRGQSQRKGTFLKLKLVGDDVDLARVEAVREAAPMARLLIDANESWSLRIIEHCSGVEELMVELIEQPFPADADEIIEFYVDIRSDVRRGRSAPVWQLSSAQTGTG